MNLHGLVDKELQSAEGQKDQNFFLQMGQFKQYSLFSFFSCLFSVGEVGGFQSKWNVPTM